MKLHIRLSILFTLLATTVLTGCQYEDVPAPTKTTAPSTSVTSSASYAVSTEPEYTYHPEALWTPLSENDIDSDTKFDKVVETENGTYYIGKYGIYDENGRQTEIAPDQKIAIAISFGIGFYLGSAEPPAYCELPNEIVEVMPEDIYDQCVQRGTYGDYIFLEYWLESQGFEVIKDHAAHYSQLYRGALTSYTCTLIITTPKQLAEFKMPYSQAFCRFFGAVYEIFAPEYVDFIPDR